MKAICGSVKAGDRCATGWLPRAGARVRGFINSLTSVAPKPRLRTLTIGGLGAVVAIPNSCPNDTGVWAGAPGHSIDA